MANRVEHVQYAILLACLGRGIHIAGDMHLTTNAIHFCHAVGLPTLNPLDERFEFAIVVPITLQIIVVNEQSQILRTILSCQTDSLSGILQVAHIILPEEVACRTVVMLQRIDALTVGTTSRDGAMTLGVPSYLLSS